MGDPELVADVLRGDPNIHACRDDEASWYTTAAEELAERIRFTLELLDEIERLPGENTTRGDLAMMRARLVGRYEVADK